MRPAAARMRDWQHSRACPIAGQNHVWSLGTEEHGVPRKQFVNILRLYSVDSSRRGPMAIQSGTHLGPYEILSAIGAGGMGEVHVSAVKWHVHLLRGVFASGRPGCPIACR